MCVETPIYLWSFTLPPHFHQRSNKMLNFILCIFFLLIFLGAWYSKKKSFENLKKARMYPTDGNLKAEFVIQCKLYGTILLFLVLLMLSILYIMK